MPFIQSVDVVRIQRGRWGLAHSLTRAVSMSPEADILVIIRHGPVYILGGFRCQSFPSGVIGHRSLEGASRACCHSIPADDLTRFQFEMRWIVVKNCRDRAEQCSVGYLCRASESLGRVWSRVCLSDGLHQLRAAFRAKKLLPELITSTISSLLVTNAIHPIG